MKNLHKITYSLILLALSSNSFADIVMDGEQAPTGYAGLSYPSQKTQDFNKSVDLSNLMADKIQSTAGKNKDDVNEMRQDALKEVAGQLGASSGLAFRMNQLKREVDTKSAELDQIFDFTRVTIDNGVLAPVLTEGLAAYAQDSDDQVRIADKMYKIESPAKFVSVYPTWRSYIRFAFPSFESPQSAYLPKNDTEKQIWDASVKEGWAKGIDQANRIFETSYSRLERDYLGMVKYKILLAEGLITPTVVAKQNLGITGGGREMSINDQVFRITDHSALNPNNKAWKVDYPVTNNVNGKLK